MKLLAALPSRQPQPNPSDAPQECPAAFWSGRSRTPSIFTGTIASELGLLWIHDRQAQDRPNRVERLRGKLRWIAIDQQARSIRYYARPAPAYVPAAPEWNAGADVCWRWCHADGSSVIAAHVCIIQPFICHCRSSRCSSAQDIRRASAPAATRSSRTWRRFPWCCSWWYCPRRKGEHAWQEPRSRGPDDDGTAPRL